VEGGMFVWAGGLKAPELVADSGLPTGHNGRIKVDLPWPPNFPPQSSLT